MRPSTSFFKKRLKKTSSDKNMEKREFSVGKNINQD
jgi:hypothetical protein